MEITLLRNQRKSWEHVWYWGDDYWSTLDLTKSPYEIWLHFHLYDKINLTVNKGSKLIYIKTDKDHAYVEITKDLELKLLIGQPTDKMLSWDEIEVPFLPIINIENHLLSEFIPDLNISIWDKIGEAVDDNLTLAELVAKNSETDIQKYKKLRFYPEKTKLKFYHGINNKNSPIYYEIGANFYKATDLSVMNVSKEEIKQTHTFHIYMEHIYSHLLVVTSDHGFIFLGMAADGTIIILVDDGFLINSNEKLTIYNFEILIPEPPDNFKLNKFSPAWKNRLLNFAKRELSFANFCHKYPYAISSCLPYGTYTEVIF